MSDAHARVRALVRAADDARGSLRAELAHTSRLSPEGLELVLRDHLETDATDAELVSFVERAECVAPAPAPETVLVVLSAHVPTAALRALAFAAARAPRVLVKPSRRDPALARLLAERVSFVGFVSGLEALTVDEAHVYGASESIRAVRAALGPGTRVLEHGPGLGLALVGARASLDEAAEALARDVIPFDQHGCLSPRFALVEGDEARAVAFARAMAEALARAERAVPMGRVESDLAADVARYRSTMMALGAFVAAPGCAHAGVGVDPEPRALLPLLPPTARVLHAAPFANEAALRALVEPIAHLITVVGVAPLPLSFAGQEVGGEALNARIAPLGQMQPRRLDGPIDLRVARDSRTLPPLAYRRTP